MKRYTLNKKKFVRFILFTVWLLFVLWFTISWACDIILHVSYEDIVNGNASNWNLLNIAVRLGEHI